MPRHKKQGFIKTQLRLYRLQYFIAFVFCTITGTGIYIVTDPKTEYLYGLYTGLGMMLIISVGIFIIGLVLSLLRNLNNQLDAVYDKYDLKTYNQLLDQATKDEETSEQFIKLLNAKLDTVRLHMPKTNWLWYQFNELRVALANFLNIDVRPVAIKHRLPLATRRFMDLIFIYHVIDQHSRKDSPKMKLPEALRYYWLYYLKYRDEIDDFGALINKKRKTKKEKQFVDLYNDNYIISYLEIKEDDEYDLIH